MARKPNYGFEKRQKELARAAKKEEKKRRKEQLDDVTEDIPAEGEDVMAEDSE